MMEDTLVKSLKPVAALVAASALALAGCSAGQITQTSSQVAAVDGATAFTENDEVSVQDVQIVLSEEGTAALKFAATNQDTSMAEHTLQSVSVNGQEVNFSPAPKAMGYNCVIVGDSAEGLERMPQYDNECFQYIETTLPNQDFAYAGNVDVQFSFDAGTLNVPATVSAPLLPAGEGDRDITK